MKAKRLSTYWNKNKFKKIFIFFLILFVPIIFFIVIYFATNAQERFDELKMAKKIYTNLFIDHKRINNKYISDSATKTINDIYMLFKNDVSNSKPKYSDKPDVRFYHKNNQTIYQFVSIDFVFGKNEFKDWKKIIILFFNKNHLLENIQYYGNYEFNK